ncbi:MAG: diacylglycerol/lipid kinase family protein [Acidimicrobiales bacterium]
MPIAPGQPWGEPGPLPAGGVVVSSDAEARAVLEEARRAGRDRPAIGLLGGDLCRTLGGSAPRARGDRSTRRSSPQEGRAHLASPEAVRFEVDVGEVLIDGRLHLFVAHLVARSRTWTRAFVAMNAAWRGSWNLGPRAHPGDGLLDTYDVNLRFGQLAAVRSRLHHGAHLPHPGIRERRTSAIQVDLGRPLSVELDGEAMGVARSLSLRVEPDALTVVV